MPPREFPSLSCACTESTNAPRRVCLVTVEIPGPVVSGGIGRTMIGLARLLVRAGHEVTVLFAGDRILRRDEAFWRTHFRRQDIRFVHLPGRPHAPRPHLAERCLASHRVCQWLTNESFDILYFHENMGLAYYVLAAKQAGSALLETLVSVGTHAPTRHALEANGMTAAEPDLVEIEAMEMACVAWADIVISPSRHMLRWLGERHWPLHERCVVQPNPLPIEPRRVPASVAPVRELVFFGRLEPGKGVDLMCDALDSLREENATGISVTFLGKNMWIDGRRTSEFLAERAAAWRFPCAVIDGADADTALAYLAGPGRIAVMPSRLENYPCAVQECIQLGIPFIASDVGGVPELVHADDRQRVLFEPTRDGLSEAVNRVVGTGAAPARPALDLPRNEATWRRWFDGAVLPASSDRAQRDAAPTFQLIVYGEANDGDSHGVAANAAQVVGVYDAGDGSDKVAALAAVLAGSSAGHVVLAHRRCRLDAATFAALASAVGGGADLYACVEASADAESGAGHLFPVHGAGALGLSRPFFGSRFLVLRTAVLADIVSAGAEFVLDPWYLSCLAYLRGYRLLPLPAPVIDVGGGSVGGDVDAYWRRLDLYRRHLPPALEGLVCFAPWSAAGPGGAG